MTKKSKEILDKKAIKADLNLDEKNSNFTNSQKQNSKAQKSQKIAKSKKTSKENLKANSHANFTSQKKPKAQKQNLNETNSQNLNSNELNSQGQSVVSTPLLSSLNSTQKLNLLDFTADELAKIISPMFRVKQIFEWIYQKYADDFSQMSSLSKEMRAELNQKFHFSPLQCVKFEQSKDKSIKYLFRLNDGLLIESVLLPMKEGP